MATFGELYDEHQLNQAIIGVSEALLDALLEMKDEIPEHAPAHSWFGAIDQMTQELERIAEEYQKRINDMRGRLVDGMLPEEVDDEQT